MSSTPCTGPRAPSRQGTASGTRSLGWCGTLAAVGATLQRSTCCVVRQGRGRLPPIGRCPCRSWPRPGPSPTSGPAPTPWQPGQTATVTCGQRRSCGVFTETACRVQSLLTRACRDANDGRVCARAVFRPGSSLHELVPCLPAPWPQEAVTATPIRCMGFEKPSLSATFPSCGARWRGCPVSSVPPNLLRSRLPARLGAPLISSSTSTLSFPPVSP